MITISVEDMRFYAYHGYYPEERMTGSYFEASVKVEMMSRPDIGKDDIEQTINYEMIHRICSDEMKKPRKLLESIAGSIAQFVLNEDRRIRKVWVRIAKLNPPLLGQVGRTAVELVVEN